MKYALISILLLLLACDESGNNDEANYIREKINIDFTIIDNSNNSGVTDSRFELAQTKSHFNKLWKKHTANRSGKEVNLKIDFDSTTVLFYHFGEFSNTHPYLPEVLNIDYIDEKIKINISQEESEIVMHAFSQPTLIIAIEKTDLRNVELIRN